MSSGPGFSPVVQPRKRQIASKSSTSLISGVPVRASIRGSCPGVRSRTWAANDSTFWERCEERFLMKCASSTTMPRSPIEASQDMCRSRIS